MKLGILLADLLIDSKNSLKIEDTNAATACLSMACRVEPESLIVLGSLLQLAQEQCFFEGRLNSLTIVDPLESHI